MLLLGLLLLAPSAPFGTVFDDPVGEGVLKPNVVSGFFRLEPFVFQDFLPLGEKLSVEGGIFQEVFASGTIF